MNNIKMDRLRRLWQGEQVYEPLESSVVSIDAPSQRSTKRLNQFSWLQYYIFMLLGVAMLWSWSMFLASGPYFQHRLRDSAGLSNNFQAAEIAVSTVTNLTSMLILTKLQSNANYVRRIVVALLINTSIFSLLAIFTSIRTSAGGYFGFLISTVFITTIATSLIQNGVFAYVGGLGIPQYTQAIMTGQAVAGVLPCIAQIISVLSVHSDDDKSSEPGVAPVRSTAALIYFLTATIISVVTLAAFALLIAQNRQSKETLDASTADINAEPDGAVETVPLLTLGRKLFWLSAAVILTFAVTMVFPVFTQRITSVRLPEDQPPLLQPQSFIPLAFLFWNVGDLLGRLLTGIKTLSLLYRPRTLFVLAACRVIWIGLYELCNIRGKGAVVASDSFYLVVVQLLFGLTNGYVGSSCMIGAALYVDDDEKEAAGGFMSLCLVFGLTIGSLASFSISV